MALKDVIAECEELKRILKPIETKPYGFNSINIKKQSDFLMLSTDKRTFYWEDGSETCFFFADGGIIYTYIITDDGNAELLEYVQKNMEITKEHDFSSCTEDEFLNNWQNTDTQKSLSEIIDERVKCLIQKYDWLPDDFFDNSVYDKVDSELLKINNRLEEAEKEYLDKHDDSVPKIYRRANLINEGIDNVERFLIFLDSNFSNEIYEKGQKYKKDTENSIKKEAKKLNLSKLNRRKQNLEIDRLYKTYNPNSKRDMHHITKKEIGYIFNELIQNQ
ncbi:hypothetical protein [Methanomicrobium mobile]|uniref:hypothetical protein n=1 Tax=Methanomicrobium mobile TaxID=2205 RepID=UPI0005B2BB81|nr:hypothetical protein [Methanomicrobium mobile]